MDDRPELKNDLPLGRKVPALGWFCLAFSPAVLLYALLMANLLGDNLASGIPFVADVIISVYACHQILMLNPKRSGMVALVGGILLGGLVGGINAGLAIFAWFVSVPPGHFW